jgi:hypothetical protein
MPSTQAQSPHSHPAFRKRGTLSQKEYEVLLVAEEEELRRKDALLPAEVHERSARMIQELEDAN